MTGWMVDGRCLGRSPPVAWSNGHTKVTWLPERFPGNTVQQLAATGVASAAVERSPAEARRASGSRPAPEPSWDPGPTRRRLPRAAPRRRR
jgi:hypothetical protein